MKVIRLTNPTTEPITLVEAQDHLRLIDGEDSDYVNAVISAAREYVETYCSRPFAAASFAVIYSGDLPIGDQAVSVPVADVTAVSAVEYRDENGAEQTWAAENYRHDADRQTLTPLDSWPSGTDLRIEVAAGATLPASIKSAMLLIMADLYELRTANVVGATVVENPAAAAMMSLYRERMGI